MKRPFLLLPMIMLWSAAPAAGADLHLSFDEADDLTAAGRSIPDGVHGKGLSLTDGAVLRIPAHVLPHSRAGTIMFWLRPHWNTYTLDAAGGLASHTFVSLTWADGAYLAFSDGWWEPAGSASTYLVAHNRRKAHVQHKISYSRDVWQHLACTWRQGRGGFLRLYDRGRLVAEKKGFPGSPVNIRGDLVVGGDAGAPGSQGRDLRADLDELAILGRALTSAEISAACVKHLPPPRHRTPAALNKPPRTRAVFDEGIGWTRPRQARETISRVADTGFNVYIPCVWHGRGTRYPSAFPVDKHVNPADDPLKRIIRLGHEAGLEVHPWICITQRCAPILKEFYTPVLTPPRAFDLHRPAFREFIVSLAVDLVSRYEVDGLNLDYARTMGVCLCPKCRAEYRKRFSRSLANDCRKRQANGALVPSLQTWQDEAIEEVIREISVRTRAVRPDLVISVDGHPRPRGLPPNPQGRHEIRWARKGYVDVIYSMDYTDSPDWEKLDAVRRELNDTASLVTLLSNYVKKDDECVPCPADDLEDRVRKSLERHPDTLGIYLYTLLDDEQSAMLKKIFRPPGP